MKLHILNDLHIEFGDFELPHTDADIAVFAGDIGVGADGLEWIADQKIDRPVIYVLGNHEYYHHEIGLIDDIKASAPANIHVLGKDAIEIDGVRFLGCTLWTDFLIFGEMDKYFSMQYAKREMADFAIIENEGRRFTPEDSITLHEQERDWLKGMLSIPFQGKTVVVTHHFPSAKSIHPRFANDMLTPAFGSHLDDLMDGERVALWLHGHTHDVFDYEINGTRVICNPRGYVGYERGEFFQPDLLVEV
jgi:predicted phosphodiesterase